MAWHGMAWGGTRWVVNYEIWNSIVSMWHYACTRSFVICIGLDFMIHHLHANNANSCSAPRHEFNIIKIPYRFLKVCHMNIEGHHV